MKKILVIGMFIGLVGIIGVQSWWLRAGQPAEHIPAALPVEPIENFLPVGPTTRLSERNPSRTGPLAKVIKQVNLTEQPLSLVIEFLRDMTSANMDVRWKDMEDANVARDTPVTIQVHDLSAARILEMALREAGGGAKLAFRVGDDDVVTITTAEVLDRRGTLRFYNIRDILVNAVRFQRSLASLRPAGNGESLDEDGYIQALTELIRESVDSSSWIENGGRQMIKYIDGKLVIIQTESNHAEIEKVLEKLREK